MDLIYKHQHIASLVAKERLGLLNEAEKEELDIWVKGNPEHQLLYERLKQKNYTEDIALYDGMDMERALEKYRSRYNRRRHFIYRWVSVAAVVVILFTVGIFLFHREKQVGPEVADIYPGSSKAELVLSDGSVRKLESVQQAEEIKVGEKVIRNTGTQVCYVCDSTPVKTTEEFRLVYNELRVPTGGEYQLVLSDGTKVWLNSQTNLRFPVEFGDKERTVYLEGEAYFEVSRDEKRPFYVRMSKEVNVEVLGTSFNVRAYGDEANIETVLEKGCVRMFRKRQDIVLKPGMRAIYSKKDKSIEADMVDTELYTAWRNGQYVFQDETVENILYKLSRWYGMDVFYQNEKAKELIFSGSIRKYNTIQRLLNAIEGTGSIHFQVKGNTIIVNSLSTK